MATDSSIVAWSLWSMGLHGRLSYQAQHSTHIHDVYMYACVLSHFSHVQLFAMLWTVAHQAPLCMGFSKQEYWSGLPFPPTGDLPDPGIEPASLASPTLVLYHWEALGSATWEALCLCN